MEEMYGMRMPKLENIPLFLAYFHFQGNSILKKLLPGLELRRGGLADELGSAIVVHDGTDLDRHVFDEF